MPEYPTRNPFPARGTSSAEESVPADVLLDWAKHTPTALLAGVRDAKRLAVDYVRAFRNATTRTGGVGCLYGPHGIGKTHAARHLMACLVREDPDAVQLYVRFQDDDFVAAYRRLVCQLSQPLLTDAILRYLGTLAGDQAADAGAPEDRSKVVAAIGADPARVFKLFADHLVDGGRVLEAQAREIAAVTGDAQRFQRALSYLVRPEFSDAAYDWLCGRSIPPDTARALGVGGRIDDPETCRYGLQLLTTLMTRGGRPFAVVLDQCEKFLLDDGVPVPANLGLLQSLVEVIPRAGGMLLLVASVAGWEAMPPDLHQRIGPGAHSLLPLEPHEARLVLHVYVKAVRQDPGAGIWPITDGGLLELLRHSGGNVRLLLQLAWAAFEAAGANEEMEIDAELVAATAVRYQHAPGLADLGMLVEARLLAAGLDAARVGETAFQLPDRRAPRAVIKLSEAVFFDDEVANAVELVAPGGDLLPKNRAALTALVVTGYVSPPVLSALRGVVHTVLVADGSPAFSRGLDELVRQIGSALAAPNRPASDPAQLSEAVRDLRAYLEVLSSQRSGESAALSRDFGEAARQLQEPATSGWRARRAQLTQRIDQVRADRTETDWAGFIKARRRVVHDWHLHLYLLVVSVAVAVAALVAVQISTTKIMNGVLLAGTVVGSGLMVYAGGRLATMRLRRARTGLETRDDLDQLARELRPHAKRDAADPAARFAYAWTEDPDRGFGALVHAILMEPLPLVRQALGRRLAMTERTPADCVEEVQLGMRERIPEVLMLLARRQHLAELERPPRTLRDLPPDLRVLVALANPGAPELAAGVRSQHPAETVLAALGVRGLSHPLARAYRGGLEQLAPGTITPNELRAAARLLSPFERDGLGAYDWLPVIPELDQLYLFFEELLYYQEEIRAYRHKS
ncbi:hypothetical protein ITP53_18675 [Nonomuraea sp. K274]|uniref:Uncharacterized protein n=1 Tax=Nonomuraea cypriaca TaxID=1187855 RepID=A0A931ACV2_9ACTN|nr:hypothetical protein [Nonomuraea cypriaca]MBF8187720.1 hypothetical protein [Nonomuraea cypriaca]